MSEQATLGAGARDTTKAWLWRALMLSLAVNLLVVGIFVGANWGLRDGPGSFAESLEGERRQLFNDLIAAKREQSRQLRREIAAKQIVVLQAMEADPFNRDRFVAAVEDVVAFRDQARRQLSEQFIGMVDQMTLDERRAYVRWFEDRRDRKKPKI